MIFRMENENERKSEKDLSFGSFTNSMNNKNKIQLVENNSNHTEIEEVKWYLNYDRYF